MRIICQEHTLRSSLTRLLTSARLAWKIVTDSMQSSCSAELTVILFATGCSPAMTSILVVVEGRFGGCGKRRRNNLTYTGPLRSALVFVSASESEGHVTHYFKRIIDVTPNLLHATCSFNIGLLCIVLPMKLAYRYVFKKKQGQRPSHPQFSF